MKEVFSRRDALSAALVMTVVTYVTYMAGLTVSILIARALAPNIYGQYAYFVWLVGVLCVLVNNGFSVSVLRFVSEKIGSEGIVPARSMYGWFQRAQWLCAIVVVPIAVLVMIFSPPSGWSKSISVFIALVMAAALAKSQFMFLVSASKGFGVFSVEAISSSVTAILSVMAVAIAFYFRSGLYVFIWIYIGVTVLAWALANFIAIKKGVVPSEPLIRDDQKSRVTKFLKWTVVLVLMGILNVGSLSIYFLNRYDAASAVAFFTIATAVTRAGMDLLSSGISSVLMTSMSRSYGAGGLASLSRATHNGMRYFHFLGLLVAGVGTFWAKPLINVLYGDNYDGAIIVMIGMVLVGGMTFSEGVISAHITVMEKQKQLVYVTIATILTGLTLSILLIPKYGIIGALISYCITKLMSFLILTGVIRRYAKESVPTTLLMKLSSMAIALFIMCFTLILWRDIGWTRIIAGILFAISLFLISAQMKYWTKDDISQLFHVTYKIPFINRIFRI